MEVDVVIFECEHCSDEDEQFKAPAFYRLVLGQHTCVDMCKFCHDAMIGALVGDKLDEIAATLVMRSNITPRSVWSNAVWMEKQE